MFIPHSTDAPIYHYPIGTIGLIVANILIFLGLCDGSHLVDERSLRVEVAEENRWDFNGDGVIGAEAEPPYSRSLGRRLELDFGEGYKPWQWLTSAFMHDGWEHMMGNMLFLGAFGLIVEGKVGTAVFLALYCGIAAVHGFAMQTVMWFAEPSFALGASGAIFGLLALVAVWAPVNEFSTMAYSYYRRELVVWEIPIWGYAAAYVGMNLLFWYADGFGMSNEALHLAGFAVGLPVGLIMLTRGLVDCEGYDLISVWRGTEGKESTVGRASRRQRRLKQREKQQALGEAEAPPQQHFDSLHDQVGQAIAAGELAAAERLQQRLTAKYPQLQWREADLRQLIRALMARGEYPHAARMIELYMARFADNRIAMQASLAKCLLKDQRPRAAAKVLQAIDRTDLKPAELESLRKLAVATKKMLDSGVVEVAE